MCKSLPWFKNNLSNLSFIRQNLSCLNIYINKFKKLVKEQRVDGSWGLVYIWKKENKFAMSKPLRCTLMG